MAQRHQAEHHPELRRVLLSHSAMELCYSTREGVLRVRPSWYWMRLSKDLSTAYRHSPARLAGGSVAAHHVLPALATGVGLTQWTARCCPGQAAALLPF